MIAYKLENGFNGESFSVLRSDGWNIPFAVGNTDYDNFKYQINHDEATLETANGVLMTPEEAKAYVATLP